MSRRTAISALAGRVIESVTVSHDDGNENPMALEIRCVGGSYFSFSVNAHVAVHGVSLLALNKNGELRNERRRTFCAEGTMPYAADQED